MDNSTIKQLRENTRTWTTPDGNILYVHNVQLENGVQGFAFGKSETAPYQIGDAVQYEASPTKDGTKLKIRKESTYNASNAYSGKPNPNKDRRIMKQSAIKNAVAIVGEGKHFSEYVKVADMLIKWLSEDGGEETAPQIETRNDITTTVTAFASGFEDNNPF